MSHLIRTRFVLTALFALTLALSGRSAHAQTTIDIDPLETVTTDGQPTLEELPVAELPVEELPVAAAAKTPAELPAHDLDLSSIEATPLMIRSSDTQSTDGAEVDGGGATLDATVYESIVPCTDVDYWAFDAVAGQQVTITMNRTWGNLDSFIELYNPYGQFRAADDDSGGNLNSRLSGTIATTGRYVIRAFSYAHATTGGYALSVTLGGGCNTCNPCSGCNTTASVTVFDGPFFNGSATTVPAGYRLNNYPASQATSIRFNGTCRGGCVVVLYRYSGWSGQHYRAETLYSDTDYLALQYDNAISYIEVYRR